MGLQMVAKHSNENGQPLKEAKRFGFENFQIGFFRAGLPEMGSVLWADREVVGGGCQWQWLAYVK